MLYRSMDGWTDVMDGGGRTAGADRYIGRNIARRRTGRKDTSDKRVVCGYDGKKRGFD